MNLVSKDQIYSEEVISLGNFVAVQKPLVCRQDAPTQTLCPLLTLEMLDIASSSVVKTSCTNFGTSVADKRQW